MIKKKYIKNIHDIIFIKRIMDRIMNNNSTIRYDSYMILYIFLDVQDDEMREIYHQAIDKHNNKILSSDFIDAGFDIFAPTQFACVNEKINKIDFSIKCSAIMVNGLHKKYPTGFYMYPRSSLSKTPLRLANSVGIIDAGYRGNLISMFDYIEKNDGNGNKNIHDKGWYLIEKGDRLIQICAPGLVPIFVELVDNIEMIGPNTTRGEGGFGST